MVPRVKNHGDPLKFKNQCHFHYDTTKSSIFEVIHNNKIINLNSMLLIYSHYALDSWTSTGGGGGEQE